MGNRRLITPFNIMVKPRGPVCNLDCQYCYFLKKTALYPGSDFRMDEALLAEFTKQYIQSQPTDDITFAWQGGEPTLMGLPFFERAVALQKEFAQPGNQIQNVIQTNGTQLDEAWGKFLKKNKFLVGISIDGPEALHNAYRVDKGGKPSFQQVMDGLRILKRHQVDFNVLTTVHSANADHPLKVYRFLRDRIKTQFLQFIPIVELDESGNVTDRSVKGEKYGQFLIHIFDEWIKRDVGKVFVQIFDIALAKWLGVRGGLCIFEETCGQALVMEHNGDLFSCDHYVDPEFLLGNIKIKGMFKLIGSKKQVRFGQAKLDRLPRYCRQCEVRFACNGGCPKNRLVNTPDGEAGLNYLCQGYRAFFKHINQPMKTMAEMIRQHQPPANIMKNTFR